MHSINLPLNQVLNKLLGIKLNNVVVPFYINPADTWQSATSLIKSLRFDVNGNEIWFLNKAKIFSGKIGSVSFGLKLDSYDYFYTNYDNFPVINKAGLVILNNPVFDINIPITLPLMENIIFTFSNYTDGTPGLDSDFRSRIFVELQFEIIRVGRAKNEALINSLINTDQV